MGCDERANQNGFNDAHVWLYDNLTNSWSTLDWGFGEQLAIDPSTAYPWVTTTDGHIYSWDPTYHWARRQDVPGISAGHIGLANSTTAYVLGGAGCTDGYCVWSGDGTTHLFPYRAPWTQFGTQGGIYLTVDAKTGLPWLITASGRILRWGYSPFCLGPCWADQTGSGLGQYNAVAIAVWNNEPWVIVGGMTNGGAVYKRNASSGAWNQMGTLSNATSIARDTSSGIVYVTIYGGPDDSGSTTPTWHKQNNVYYWVQATQ
jgi:hypothetical protein